MPLGMVRLVDFCHFPNGPHFLADLGFQYVFQGAPPPKWQDLIPKRRYVLLGDLKSILGPGRQGLDFLLHPL